MIMSQFEKRAFKGKKYFQSKFSIFSRMFDEFCSFNIPRNPSPTSLSLEKVKRIVLEELEGVHL